MHNEELIPAVICRPLTVLKGSQKIGKPFLMSCADHK